MPCHITFFLLYRYRCIGGRDRDGVKAIDGNWDNWGTRLLANSNNQQILVDERFMEIFNFTRVRLANLENMTLGCKFEHQMVA